MLLSTYFGFFWLISFFMLILYMFLDTFMGQPICAATVVLSSAVSAVRLSHCTYQNYHIICTYETMPCSTEYRSSWGSRSVPILKVGTK